MQKEKIINYLNGKTLAEKSDFWFYGMTANSYDFVHISKNYYIAKILYMNQIIYLHWTFLDNFEEMDYIFSGSETPFINLTD